MKYVISSTSFTSKKRAVEQIKEWINADTLDKKTRVYEVGKEYQPLSRVETVVRLVDVEAWEKNKSLAKSKSKVKKRV